MIFNDYLIGTSFALSELCNILDKLLKQGAHNMRKSLLSLSILSALAMPNITMAEEAAAPAKEEASKWSVTTNIGFGNYL